MIPQLTLCLQYHHIRHARARWCKVHIRVRSGSGCHIAGHGKPAVRNGIARDQDRTGRAVLSASCRPRTSCDVIQVRSKGC